MKIEAVFFRALFGVMVFTELGLADVFEVKEAVEGVICRKLATDYANDSTTLTIQAIAQLQICLAQTLKNSTSSSALPLPRNFDIQPSRSSTSIGDTTLPTPPTPPTPPKSLKIR
ncbi:hypothetical protein [Nitrospira sp. Ecomares 2.1]